MTSGGKLGAVESELKLKLPEVMFFFWASSWFKEKENKHVIYFWNTFTFKCSWLLWLPFFAKVVMTRNHELGVGRNLVEILPQAPRSFLNPSATWATAGKQICLQPRVFRNRKKSTTISILAHLFLKSLIALLFAVQPARRFPTRRPDFLKQNRIYNMDFGVLTSELGIQTSE